jgi:hypothetical protein
MPLDIGIVTRYQELVEVYSTSQKTTAWKVAQRLEAWSGEENIGDGLIIQTYETLPEWFPVTDDWQIDLLPGCRTRKADLVHTISNLLSDPDLDLD